MSHTNGTFHSSTNGRTNGKHTGASNGRKPADQAAKVAPLPAANRIAALLSEAFRPTRGEEACLSQIAELWQTYLHRGLETRHQIGKLLNQQIGGPDDRQDRGKGVMALASERLGIGESDLNRMRWTAHLFKSVKDLRVQHPQIDSWTKLKEKLPSLMPRSGKKRATAGPAARFVRTVARSIQSLTAAIRRNRTAVKLSDQSELLEQFRELAAAVEAKLHIRVVVTKPKVKDAS